ncbi:MAG: hypothetical protein ACREQP_03885 [Candidatus Binatia bacterium]
MTASEEYNDNIFFSNQPRFKNESDFITAFTPTFTALYSSPGQPDPIFVANVSPSGQIYAHHSELNNLGDNINANAIWTYRYSPRLTFIVSDALSRGGVTRTGFGAEGLNEPTTPTTVPPPGTPPALSENQDLTGLLNRGRTFQNNFSANAAYLATPKITISGRYGSTYTRLSTVGDSEIGNSVGIRGAYRWADLWGGDHNLHLGYTVTHFSRTGGDNSDSLVHSIDFGDDYLSALQIRLTPTLTLSLSTGLALNTGGKGPKIANNSSATIIKLWPTATFQAGARSGLGSNFGVSSGIAQTTTFFGGFEIRLTQNLRGILQVDYTMINGDDNDTNVLRATNSLQYWITTWLTSSLSYNHRWRKADDSTASLSRGRVASNSVILSFTAHFDVWPYVGLSRAPMREFLIQPGLPPFAAPPAPESPTPSEPPQPQSPGPPS